jgi:hypothetical protein
LAGDSAHRLFAPVEAREHYENALANLALLPETGERLREQIAITTGYATVAFGRDPPEQILARLTAVDSRAQNLKSADGAIDREDRLTLA